MVISILATTIRLAFRYRKGIYKVLTAQDRAIGSAWRKGGYGRQTQYGVRTGAAAGTLTAPFITNIAPDSPGNELQKPIQKKQQYTSRPSNQTRNRPTTRSSPECPTRFQTKYFGRRSRTSKYR